MVRPSVMTAAGVGSGLGRSSRNGAFVLVPRDSSSTIHCSSTLPYGLAQWEAFARHAFNGESTSFVSTLASSEAGRDIPVVILPGERSQSRIVVTARQHACEASASLVLEGILLEALQPRMSGGSPPELVAVPFVDIDGVEAGDQGKGRLPHDHNRDYGETRRYAVCRAIEHIIASTAQPTACIDLHTPGLHGPLEERPFLASSDEPEDYDAVRELSAQVGNEFGIALPILVFAEDWNRTSGAGVRCLTAWARSMPSVRLAAVVEYPNAIDRGRGVTRAAARCSGEPFTARSPASWSGA